MTQERLRASEERFRGFAENSVDVLWIADRSGTRLEYLSPAFERTFGERRDRIMADLGRWRELVHPDDRASAAEFMPRAATGAVAIAHYRVIRPADGQVVYLRDTGFPIRDASGAIAYLAGIVQDITDIEQAATALRESEAALRHLNEALETRVAERTGELMAAEASLRQSQKLEAVGQLTGGIAHDFNNMLQGITGSLELMRRRAEQGRAAEAARYVESVRRTVQRAAALTHRLLAFARQLPLDPAPVNLDRLATGMEELVRRAVGPAVQVELRLGNSTWPVLCDENQMENALLNLCVNARDAMPDGGWLTISTGEAQLSAADLAAEEGLAPGAYAMIAVTDTGVGMAPDVMARAFEPFFTTKPLGQGTGLGLSQIYGFVRQSGGVARIESAPGQGTTVRLFLPRHEPTLAEDTQDGATTTDVVLLVEDEESLRQVAAEWLREAGHRVLEAPDGAAARRLLHGAGRVDLLVTDVGLPGGTNGRQVAEAARAHRPGLPVLFMTGYAGMELPPGMEVIRKPFTLDELADRVWGLLEMARSRRSAEASDLP
ncbi:MAG: PAS domain S-box protein [Acetobacteraceae bacterium]|nr:PAS domain S-box protein [Acetobacteraceae bacterium]